MMTARAALAGAFRGRCVGSRHLPGQPLPDQAPQPAPQQFGHVRPFAGARRHQGQAEGNITIFWFDHGWFWFIPFPMD
jgi:hypothetical protein